MDDKDLQEKVLELQDEVCIRFIKYHFIQLYYSKKFSFQPPSIFLFLFENLAFFFDCCCIIIPISFSQVRHARLTRSNSLPMRRASLFNANILWSKNEMIDEDDDY